MVLPIAHIGVLVADLETAREHWSTVLGMPFSPISRYRPATWCDLGNPVPHLHDARLTFCLGVDPSIEILEFVGNGTHSPGKGEGGHHLAFPPLADNALRRRELAALGVGTDGEVWHGERCIFMFSDARALNNVYLEWVEESPAHVDVKDDGSPVDHLPDGTKTLFEVETILDLDGRRPWSGITEFGVSVQSLGPAGESWSAVTGSPFSASGPASFPGGRAGASEPASLLAAELVPPVRLVEQPGQVRQGLNYAIVTVPSLDAARERLEANSVPLLPSIGGSAGESDCLDVDPSYLNGFQLRLQA